jgi:omega-6 fatty acid desaturase (delta-12 desaturase)
MHHATSGNLSRRGTGDVDTLTVSEFRGLPAWQRRLYWLSRHPAVLLGVAPLYLFVLRDRLPIKLMRSGRQAWLSALSTNLAIATVAGLAIAMVGVRDFLLIQAPITLLAATAGVWLFYVQHQFEDTWWEQGAGWNAHAGALRGSSHYDLPQPLRWLTANIGVHHVHHLCSRIPGYRLGEVLRDHPELRQIGRLTLGQSLGCLRLALWDENRRRLVSFREARLSMSSLAV